MDLCAVSAPLGIWQCLDDYPIRVGNLKDRNIFKNHEALVLMDAHLSMSLDNISNRGCNRLLSRRHTDSSAFFTLGVKILPWEI